MQVYEEQCANQAINHYLVRFGGAGACLPLLFVVLRIWTRLFFDPPVKVDSFADPI